MHCVNVCVLNAFLGCLTQDQAMVGYELTKTIGDDTATYKFTPKYVLKAGQKVTVIKKKDLSLNFAY